MMSVAADSITVMRMQSVLTLSGDIAAPANPDTWGMGPSAEVSLLLQPHQKNGRLLIFSDSHLGSGNL